MTKYEMLYILDNSLTDEVKDGIIKKIEDLVTSNGGVVEKTDRWGVKTPYPPRPPTPTTHTWLERRFARKVGWKC